MRNNRLIINIRGHWSFSTDGSGVAKPGNKRTVDIRVHGSHSAQKTGLNLGLFQVLIDVILGDQDERDHRRFIEFASFNRRFNNVDPGGELSHAVLKDGRA